MNPPLTRKLGLGHFAYLRAIVQGLDTAACWERYLAIEGQSRPGSARSWCGPRCAPTAMGSPG